MPKAKGRTLKPFSDEEKDFVMDIMTGMEDLSRYTPTSPGEVKFLASVIADAFSSAWLKNSSEYTISAQSKVYWNGKCLQALAAYRLDSSVTNYKVFRSVVKAAKRKFFNDCITEVSKSNKRPWDLMEWVKERKNPPCEAIQFNGQPCHDMDALWDALHNTYNSMANRPVDLSILNELHQEPEREWPEFSELELKQALDACSSRSSPGPNHVMWRHLKQILVLPVCTKVVLTLPNACIETGRWPKHFKESTSVIIPKPNKFHLQGV
jgi:hypothetical protein